VIRRALLCVLVGCGPGAPAPVAPVANTTPAPVEPPAIDDREAVEDTSVQVRRLAFEGYPQWSVAHPNDACPASLAALLEYFEGMTTLDPWGTELRMFCGPSLPPGVKGFGVQSAGPDRTHDTPDDVESWD
jgi:hypothetical protein